MVVDSMAERFNVNWDLRRQWEADVATISQTLTLNRRKRLFPTERGPHVAPGGPPTPPAPRETYELDLQITLLKPRKFMNLCGNSISRASM